MSKVQTGVSIAGKVYNLLSHDLRVTKELVCGMVGNMWSESRFIPTIKEPGGSGEGLAQWSGSTKVAINQYANRTFGKNILACSLDEQLLIYKYFLEVQEKGHYNNILNSNAKNNVHDSALAILEYIERAAPATAHADERISMAQAVAKLWDPNIVLGTAASNLSLTTGSFADNVWTSSLSTVTGGVLTGTALISIDSSLDTSDGSLFVPPPRIYQEFPPTIEVDELSIPYQQEDGNFDTSIKTSASAVDSSSSVKSVTNAASKNTQEDLISNQAIYRGYTYPVIRINDHYISYEELIYFELKIIEFIPTIELHILTNFKDLSKSNIVKDGDKCAVFLNSDIDGIVRSLRADFIITNVETSKVEENIGTQKYSYIILGELYIPDIHNNSIKYAYTGSSRDSIRDVAQKLGLGFFFNDPEDTQDTQVWQCTPTDGGPMLFIEDVTSHAWKGNDYFFDSWIDPRYAITFLNINTMLGTDGKDQGLDLTKFTSIIANLQSLKVGAAKNIYNYKLFNNIFNDGNQFSPYYVLNYNIVNQAYAITKEVGLNVKSIININNYGMDDEANNVDIQYQIACNQWKLNNGFYALLGPGTNLTYTQADTGDYAEQQAKVNPGFIQDTFATVDTSIIKSTGGNELASGNVAQTYKMAEIHNYINNMQLEKMYINIECPGCNLSIIRGEKVPMLLIDRSSMAYIENEADTQNKELRKSEKEIDATYDTTGCGWFIIDGISYVYNPFAQNVTSGANSWTTKVKLTRREWPTPVPSENPANVSTNAEKINAVQTLNRNIASGTVIDKTSSTTETNTSSTTNQKTSSEVTTEGLKSYIVDIYNSIKNITNNNIQLISGKRWAVDKDNNKVDGNAFVKKGNLYKCITSTGEILWFTSYNSKHLYGEAIDIVNKSGYSLSNILDNIVSSNECLLLMYENGVSVYLETSTDDNGVSVKHLHIGTDKIGQKAFWDHVYSVRKTYMINGKSVANYLSKSSASAEIKHAIVLV